MRYYQVFLPHSDKPIITTSLRGVHDLPEGTHISGIVTERDGSLAEQWNIPVINGRPQITGRGNRLPKAAQGRY